MLFLLAPAAARASQIAGATTRACITGEFSCTPASTVRVDQAVGIEVAVQIANTISQGNSIYIEGPEGLEFFSPEVTLNSNGGNHTAFGSSTFNGGRGEQVVIPSGAGTITGGSTVEVFVGYFQNQITLPPTPGQLKFKVWSSADTEPRETSNAITTTAGEPASLSAVNELNGTVGQSLATPEAKLTDSRGNPISGQTITFEVPASGPGGSFAGGATSATGVTDASGVATPSAALTANGQAGIWHLALSGPNSTTGSLTADNGVGVAKQITLQLSPPFLPANGSSTAAAKVLVEDEFGNRVLGDEVTLETGGGPSATVPALEPDEAFHSTLTASTTPGEYTITASDVSVVPHLSTTGHLAQAPLPATSISLALEPASILADGSSQTVAVATLKNELGNPVSGEEVVFASSGGNAVGSTVESAPGTYRAPVTATASPGTYTITATDKSLEPNLHAAAQLTQLTQLAPTPAPTPPAGAPVATIQSGPKGGTRARRARFAFSASGAAAFFECRLDRRAWARCGSPDLVSFGVGKHVFAVRAVGADGTAGPVAERGFRRLPRRHHRAAGHP
ncbi:MAG TPA: invasin domain 3-containing protein [Solirubrobacterales bacterium]